MVGDFSHIDQGRRKPTAGRHCKEARRASAAAAAAAPGGLPGLASPPAGSSRGRPGGEAREGRGAGQHRAAGPAYPGGNNAPESGGGRLEPVRSKEPGALHVAQALLQRQRTAPAPGRGAPPPPPARPPRRGKTPLPGLHRSRAARGEAARPHRSPRRAGGRPYLTTPGSVRPSRAARRRTVPRSMRPLPPAPRGPATRNQVRPRTGRPRRQSSPFRPIGPERTTSSERTNGKAAAGRRSHMTVRGAAGCCWWGRLVAAARPW